MDLELQGKSVLVVGASNGLGLAATKLLLTEGAKVIGVARRSIDIATEGGSTVKSVQADLHTHEGQSRLQEVLAAEEPLRGILCTVGSGRATAGTLLERYLSSHDRNIVPTLRALEAGEPFLAKDAESAVVLTASIAGVEYIDCPAEYAATKAAVVAYTAHLARKWAPVRVNSLAPGNMMSTGSVWEKWADEDPEALQKYLDANVALGRVGSPAEVARVAVILLSPVASFVTGSTVVVDGGQSRSW
jgi:3-oxoacyl-[acyl-carrier protein] reductase